MSQIQCGGLTEAETVCLQDHAADNKHNHKLMLLIERRLIKSRTVSSLKAAGCLQLGVCVSFTVTHTDRLVFQQLWPTSS